MKDNLYKYPMALTQQFKHCGNPFRIDTYKGCDFGCKYCFSNARGGNHTIDFKIADFSLIEKAFFKAFESDKEYKDLTTELIKNKVPLHLGGMSDPFQSREFQCEITYKLIKLTNKYNYPMLISTKCGYLPKKYLEIINPNIHAFQISLISNDNSYIKLIDSNAPSATERINFIKQLYHMGFWVGLRLQPLIDIEHAINLIKEIDGYIKYITVEHLKIATDNHKIKDFFKLELESGKYIKPKNSRNYEMKTEIKLENIQKIKGITKIKIGCGDNDLHELSDSNNCCGIDTINENFNNWIKYNSMYINKTQDRSQWYPKNNCSQCFNSECRKKGFSFKDYVDNFITT